MLNESKTKVARKYRILNRSGFESYVCTTPKILIPKATATERRIGRTRWTLVSLPCDASTAVLAPFCCSVILVDIPFLVLSLPYREFVG